MPCLAQSDWDGDCMSNGKATSIKLPYGADTHDQSPRSNYVACRERERDRETRISGECVDEIECFAVGVVEVDRG